MGAVTLCLYFIFWLPGLIANIVYWRNAKADERLSGYKPQGAGCLFWLLIWFVVLPLVGVIVIAVLLLLGSLATRPGAGLLMGLWM